MLLLTETHNADPSLKTVFKEKTILSPAISSGTAFCLFFSSSSHPSSQIPYLARIKDKMPFTDRF